MKLIVALLMVTAVILSTTVLAEEDEHMMDEHIHLPGKTCDDAPPCPDNRPCVMAPPHCNKGTCGTEPVPTCGPAPS